MAAVSIFDIFKIGIGPSSSHTVGPMKAALAFVTGLGRQADRVAAIDVALHGSLAWTGKGHGTDSAVILGLMGLQPETIDPDAVDELLRDVHETRRLRAEGIGEIEFDPAVNIRFDYDEELPRHTNGMRFAARDKDGGVIASDDYYSLGGGSLPGMTNPSRGSSRVNRRCHLQAATRCSISRPATVSVLPSSCIATN